MPKNELSVQAFQNAEFGEIRVVNKDNAPLFVVKDICKAFNVSNQNRALSQLDPDEKGYTQINTPGGKQKTAVVNEAGLYALLFALQPTKARGISKEETNRRIDNLKKFKRWVTHEVLPAIHRTGGYMVTKANETPEEIMARAVLIAQDTINRQKQQIADMQPKALFADAVAASRTSILVGELVKLLKQNGVDIGQNRLFKWLRENGYLMKTGSSYNMPTQRSMEQELFEVKETSITHSDGHITVQKTPKVTGKGQQYFINRFLTKGEVA